MLNEIIATYEYHAGFSAFLQATHPRMVHLIERCLDMGVKLRMATSMELFSKPEKYN